MSAAQALQALSTIRLVSFRLDGQRARRGVSTGSPRARQILKGLGISNLKPPLTVGTEITVM